MNRKCFAKNHHHPPTLKMLKEHNDIFLAFIFAFGMKILKHFICLQNIYFTNISGQILNV